MRPHAAKAKMAVQNRNTIPVVFLEQVIIEKNLYLGVWGMLKEQKRFNAQAQLCALAIVTIVAERPAGGRRGQRPWPVCVIRGF